MWKTIMSSPRTAGLVQLLLLDVMEDWPEHSTCTSDGDKRGVFALAATLVMWKILQVPCVPHVLTMYSPWLFVHLLFQVFFSTVDTPEEVDTFWKACQEQHGLATSPNRFAVQTLKSLLCRMHYEDVVVAMERKRGWDTLISADSHKYAVGLLAGFAVQTLKSLLCRMHYEDVVVAKERKRGWDTLISADSHKYAVGLLAGEMRQASIPLCSNIAFYLLGLLNRRQPHWDLPALAFLVEDSSHMQLLSVVLHHVVIQMGEKRKKPLKTPVRQSPLSLFWHCHDENPYEAEMRICVLLLAAWKTLLCATKFLHKRNLEKLLRKRKLRQFSECLPQLLLITFYNPIIQLIHKLLPTQIGMNLTLVKQLLLHQDLMEILEKVKKNRQKILVTVHHNVKGIYRGLERDMLPTLTSPEDFLTKLQNLVDGALLLTTIALKTWQMTSTLPSEAWHFKPSIYSEPQREFHTPDFSSSETHCVWLG
ncbi:hypothetical protein HGM15179_018972 [Zosterops borbonicus]|uniref:Uncharacterized protein n=1 Tax=Zosterops borbonicus TaxID=364589 RepID=A0A8K1DA74_9PASS|nr:hypothetical protein HGM15179_018972 [Zosterops borbonicus]